MKFKDFCSLATSGKGEETCEVTVVEAEVVEEEDDSVEADLNEALNLLGECQVHMKAYLTEAKPRSSRGPTLKYKEIEALAADLDIFLSQWTWENNGNVIDVSDAGGEF